MATVIVPQRQTEKKISIIVLTAMIAFVLVGFGSTYYFNPANALTFRTLTHVHAFTMLAWVILLVVQTTLVRTRNVKLHMKLGIGGVVLVLVMVMVPVGLIVAVQAAKYGSPSFPPVVPPLAFMAVPFLTMAMFAIVFAAAILRRRVPADHRRLMLLTAVVFMGPALARIPSPALQSLGPLLFIGFPVLTAIVSLAVDSIRSRKVNKAFLLGTIFVAIGSPLMLVIGGTETWLAFAAWLAG